MDAVKKAFSRVREDMLQLRSEIEELKNTTAQILSMVDGKVSSGAVEEFVATKNGKKYHTPQCSFVENIAPKNKIVFESEEKAKKAGLKKCTCVK